MDADFNFAEPVSPHFLRKWGFWAVLTGGLALLLVFAQIIGPTLETRPSAATQIGEIAGEIKRSAWRSFLGLSKPEPEIVEPTLWSYAAMAAPVLGILAIVLSLLSAVMKEPWRFSAYGLGLGVAAVTFQFVWMLALLIVGIILLSTILENLGDIFSF